MTEMQYQVNNWYHFCWAGGDNICEQHVHNLDVCNWVMDDHPVEANGMGGCTERYLGDNKGTGQIFDHHFVEFTYKDGTKLYSQCRHMANTLENVSEHAIGDGRSGTRRRLRPAGRKRKSRRQRRPQGKFHPGDPYVQEHVDLHRRHQESREVQRRLVRRDQQLDRRAGPHGDLLRQGREVGRCRGQRQVGVSHAACLGRPAPVQKDADGNYPIPMPGVYQPY